MSDQKEVTLYIDPLHILAVQTLTEEIRVGLVIDQETDHLVLCLEKVNRATNRLLEKEYVVLGPRKMETVEAFHRLIYDIQAAGFPCSWCGIPTLKYPPDLWVMQEVIWQTKPEVVIETGTYAGGSALFYAQVLRALQGPAEREWRVITVDTEPQGNIQDMKDRWDMLVGAGRVSLVVGDSESAQVAERVDNMVRKVTVMLGRAARVMVILDSGHAMDHVLRELEIYAPLVYPGCYLIVEDTNINGHPVAPAHGPGPAEALAVWLPQHAGEFEVDRSRERYLVTFQPGGWLRRKEG